VVLSRDDKAKLRRAGVLIISADPADVRAIEALSVIPLNALLRAALETVDEKRSYANGQEIRSDFAHRLIAALLPDLTPKPARAASLEGSNNGE
jgi:hypothetical protein